MTKNNLPLLITKVVISIVAVYVSIAYGFFAFSKIEYTYSKQSALNQNLTILMQPFMEIFGDSKVSHWYDWQTISESEIDKKVNPLVLKSKNSQYGQYSSFSYKNVIRILGGVKEAVIVQPLSYSKNWSLISCNKQENVCIKSDLLHTGPVKILVDGENSLWGIDQSSNYIELKLIKLIDRSENKDILFI
jgi:hypothetical protein